MDLRKSYDKKNSKIYAVLVTLAMSLAMVLAMSVTEANAIAPIDATGVTLDSATLTLYVSDESKDTATLTATLAPEDANSTVGWTSSDEAVATVADGTVTAVAAGEATITATAENYDSDDVTAECKVTVVELKEYPVYVGDTVVTNKNASDVLGDGTVSYDADTNTLTLNGATIEKTHPVEIESTGAIASILSPVISAAEDVLNTCIYSEESLNVVLSGSNELANDEAPPLGILTIGSDSALNISGDGSLTCEGLNGLATAGDEAPITIAGGTVTVDGLANGITSVSDVIIKGGTVIATGNAYGILSMADINISGGKVTASGSAYGMMSGGDLKISGGTVLGDGTMRGMYSRENLTISGGKVTATSTAESSVAINARKNAKVSGGTVAATGGYGLKAENIYVSGSATSLTATVAEGGAGNPLRATSEMPVLKISKPLAIVTPGDGKVAAVSGAVTDLIVKDKNGYAAKKVVVKYSDVRLGEVVKVGGNSYTVTSLSGKTVAFKKAKNAKTVTVPSTIKYKNTTLTVKGISSKAFSGKKTKTVVVKSKNLTKASVKGSLKGSKVTKVKVNVGKKSLNKTYAKKYKKIFTKSNAGKKVTVTA